VGVARLSGLAGNLERAARLPGLARGTHKFAQRRNIGAIGADPCRVDGQTKALRRFQGLLAIAKNWCQSFLSHIARSRVSGTQDALTLKQSDAPTTLAVASRAHPICKGRANYLYSGIRHNPSGVQNRLGNVSEALRKRNYHVGWRGMYRMDTTAFSTADVSVESDSFHVEQNAN
jgi:hypothetical protein